MRTHVRRKAHEPITRQSIEQALQKFRAQGGLIRRLPDERTRGLRRAEIAATRVDPLWDGEII